MEQVSQNIVNASKLVERQQQKWWRRLRLHIAGIRSGIVSGLFYGLYSFASWYSVKTYPIKSVVLWQPICTLANDLLGGCKPMLLEMGNCLYWLRNQARLCYWAIFLVITMVLIW